MTEDEDAPPAPQPVFSAGAMTPAEADQRLAGGIVTAWARRHCIGADQKVGVVLGLLPEPALHSAVKAAARRGDAGELVAVAAWAAARIERDNAAHTYSAELFDDFLRWVGGRDVPFDGGRRAFINRLRRLGLRSWRDRRTGKWGFKGICLRPVMADASATSATAATSEGVHTR